MKDETSAKKEAATALEQQAKKDNADTQIRKYGDYYIIPTLKITREKFNTNKGKDLWSYCVKVQFYNQEKLVRLQTPNVEKADSFRKTRDKYGYQILDAMFDVLQEIPLAVRFVLTADGDLRSVEYYVCGFEKADDGTEILVDHIPLVTTTSSSEAVLRSAINRLSIKHGWNLPTL